MNLAIASYLIRTGQYDAGFVRRWWNWEQYLTQRRPDLPPTFEAFQDALAGLYAGFTFEYAAAESGIGAAYEQYDGQWIGFRQPVLRAARERLGEDITDTRQVNPGEVWEENEWWTELSWRIDPDGSLGIRQYHESRAHPGQKLTVDEYYGWMFENSVPGLPERAAAEGLTPLAWMRRYGAFEIASGQGGLHEREVPDTELRDVAVGPAGQVYTAAAATATANIVPMATPDPDSQGRRQAGVMVDGTIRRGFPTPSGRLEFWSSTLADWGWPEHALPGYIKSHVHPSALAPGQMVLLSTVPAADSDPHPLGEQQMAG